ncbi:CRISPR-associated protein Csy1 [Lampropedia cohaerens]|uniref:CRISPR-associated protein Csy1 n=1 Tax=Lampropedia cohaerens TaxID=1610491 RepID=A0A0U1Q1Y3_9BURK|nr:type I-F CRISPR-associated protein Csy1 [Lampropedia cohaerens]KKW68768.1 CRISPR-associated protein Csy1 [Lampropedia cohaerens]
MPTEQTLRVRSAIQTFLHDRLQDKLSKLAIDDPKRVALEAQFQPATWLQDAARRVKQIQAVTHALKPIHPDARGTNLYRTPTQLPQHELVGSHSLAGNFSSDVVGNAAALDVYKFLKIDIDGISLLDLLLAGDDAALHALSDDEQQAKEWASAFISLTQERGAGISSHARAKQLYWMVGSDASADEDYHLLAPLYATSLAHAVYQDVQEARFGEANKQARAARREGKMHDGVFRDYPQLAVQKLGGTKPQNISQLNSERGGNNYLLASLPPSWRSRLRAPWGIRSVIDEVLLHREGVRAGIQALLDFLLTDPPANTETRRQVDEHVAGLIDDLVLMAAELQREWAQAYGETWTADARCKLVAAEQLWLNPQRAQHDEEFNAQWQAMDWPAQIGHRFGNWLNAQLAGKLPVGEAEHRQWQKELLLDEGEGGWASTLHSARTANAAPQYIPSRKGNAP